MKHALVVAAFAALAGLIGNAASAATIYRCGHEYTDVACADGQPLVVASAVSAEQRADAREVARREKALAAEMARDRRADEATRKPALAGSLSGLPAAAAAPAPAARKHPKKHRKNATPDEARDFVATVPKARKAAS